MLDLRLTLSGLSPLIWLGSCNRCGSAYILFRKASNILHYALICTDLVRSVQLKCDGTRGRMGGEVKGKLANGGVASTLHTTSEHGISSITTADARNSAASSRLNWRPCRFKWTRPFRRKTKSGFCACAITFQTHSNTRHSLNWDVDILCNFCTSLLTVLCYLVLQSCKFGEDFNQTHYITPASFSFNITVSSPKRTGVKYNRMLSSVFQDAFGWLWVFP
jgi:hypothetical protein